MKKDLNHYLSLKYPIILIPEEDGSWFIQYPDLPGCMSCGDTMKEAIESGEDAKKCWVECGLEHGDPIPEPLSAKIFEWTRQPIEDIPGMKESILEAANEPLDECLSIEEVWPDLKEED